MESIWTPELPGSRDGPLYRAIARALEADIRAGRLAAGERLPTHRDLADRLGVNTGTVSRAYAECERAGWIQGEVGRGTFVRTPGVTGGQVSFGRAPQEVGVSLVDLSLNLPVSSPAPDLAAALRSLASEIDAGAPDDLQGYRGPEGTPLDREAGAHALALHGVRVAAESVVLAAGAQHGLAVALAATCRPGDTVAAERLVYPGLQAIAASHGVRLAPVDLDEHGVVPASLEEVCRTHAPRAVYLSPTLQNPTGSTLARERREQVADVAERSDLWIIEDDVHRLLEPSPPPPLFELAGGRVVFVAGLSKCLVPSLRVAYLAVPERLRERLVEEVWSSVWMISPITAALASRWVMDGTLERIATGRRREARARQELAVEVLAGLPEGFRVPAPSHAYHLWLGLDETWNATAFANAARDRGVLVTPADAFHLGPGAAPAAVRISLSSARDRAELARALDILVEVGAGRTRPPVRL